jgi:hypothetical protein
MGGGGGNCGVVNFPVDYIGGGGGGGGCNDAGFDYVGGNGGTGAIIITYYACTNPNFTSSSSMFLMFG